MISIRVDSNIDQVSKWLTALHADQLPFAQSRAINATAKDFQDAERRVINQEFTVRRQQWVDRSVKITKFAAKRDYPMFAEIAIAPPGGRGDILAKFEDGGTKSPTKGGKSVVIPDAVKRSKSDIVTNANRPRSMHFRFAGSGPKAKVFKGDKRTFMIQYHDGTGAIYQRVRGPAKRTRHGNIAGRRRGARDSTLKRLFKLTPNVHINSRLQFHSTARRTVQDNWRTNFLREFNSAVRNAR